MAKAVASLMQGDNAPADMDYPRAKAFSAALLAELSNDIGSLEESGLVAKSPDNAFFLASAKGRDYIAQLMVDGITKRALQRARSEVLAGDAAS
ncbi:MAG: hypothetical protein OXH12_08725 [Chloroflexi bacterium]|nr:hypothetical protein [Chloroflexota bacterium]